MNPVLQSYTLPVSATEIAIKFWVADVVFDSRTAGLDSTYTYQLENEAVPGTAVLAPLGNRTALGYVISCRKTDGTDLGYSIEKLRAVQSVLPEVSIPEEIVDLVRYTADEYLCPLSVALSPALPPGVLDRMQTTWKLTEKDHTIAELSPIQQEIVSMVKAKGGTFVVAPSRKLESAMVKALKLLQAKGILEKSVEIADASAVKPTAFYRLTHDGTAIDKFLSTQAKKKPAQALTLVRLREIESARLTTSDIKGLCGVTDATIKSLIEAGLLELETSESMKGQSAPQLNSDQKIAVDALIEAIEQRQPTKFLLFGVTGSGKTEVYMRAAAEAIKMGRQVLYLVPEIALASQAVHLLRERFGRSVAILHSELPPRERLENWMSVKQGKSVVVLGARSALFAPLGNIGFIIVDEEHEGSYKQESAPRYHAKRLAQFLADRHKCPVVFGSATPSIESNFEAEQEKLVQLSLPRRAASAQLPVTTIVDLGEGFRNGAPVLFTDLLVQKMSEVLERKEQIILFLNRRSYAPFLICRDCGERFLCPNCSVSLSFSQKIRRLRCHHCGHSEIPPEQCPKCLGSRVRTFGVGTEKVEEAVREHFPTARVARLDRDVTQKRGALEAVLGSFGAGETDILVGTQMVAKGLNFPGVTLVGILAADLSLNMPDFRAAERTFQLLNQVAGRAGRGSRLGEVVLQTFNPDNVAIQSAAEHKFYVMYESLLQERRDTNYPPFCRLVNILHLGMNLREVQEAANQTADFLRPLESEGVHILGPVDCAIDRINKQWRWHVLLKLPPNFIVARVAELLKVDRAKGVNVVIDVDAYSLL